MQGSVGLMSKIESVLQLPGCEALPVMAEG